MAVPLELSPTQLLTRGEYTPIPELLEPWQPMAISEASTPLLLPLPIQFLAGGGTHTHTTAVADTILGGGGHSHRCCRRRDAVGGNEDGVAGTYGEIGGQIIRAAFADGERRGRNRRARLDLVERFHRRRGRAGRRKRT